MRFIHINTFIFLSFLMAFCNIANSQVFFDSSYQNNGEVSGESIRMTSDSGYVITGFTNPTNSFFGQEVLLMKIDKNGNQVFSTYFGGVGFDIGRSVIETYDKGFVLCGSFSSSSTISDDMYIIKTDSVGNFQWQATIGDTIDDNATDIIQLPTDSSFIVSGDLNDFPAIVKLNKDGDTLWTKIFNNNNGRINSVTHTSNDNFLLAGIEPMQKGLILLTDNQGNEIWREVVDGNGAEEYYGSAELQNGTFVVAGRTLENGVAPNSNAVLRYFDQNGSLLDFQTFGTNKQEHFFDLCISDNNVIAVGNTIVNHNNNEIPHGLIVRVDLDSGLSYNDVIGNDTINALYLNDITLTHDGYYMICGLLSNTDGAHVYVAKLDVTGSVLDINDYPTNDTFDISLFPNPMLSQATLLFTKPLETESELIVFSSKGERVKSSKISQGSKDYKIHRDNLSTGIYFVNLVIGKNKYIKKLIIN